MPIPNVFLNLIIAYDFVQTISGAQSLSVSHSKFILIDQKLAFLFQT